MEAYIAEGKSGLTYGLHVDGTTYTQVVYPSGDTGSISTLEEFDGWSLQRWIGQMGAEECSLDDIPKELSAYPE